MDKLEVFQQRLKGVGIGIELTLNWPWVYLSKVNDKTVKDKYRSDHGFTIAFMPIQHGRDIVFTELSEVFGLIRKYINNE